MLEALVSLRHKGEQGLKKRGDILVVKLAGSPWGDEERRFHQLVEWEDAELEHHLNKSLSEVDPTPAIVHPYAEYDEETVLDEHGDPDLDPETGQPVVNRFMVSRSTEQVDIDLLAPEIKAGVTNPNVEQPCLKTTEYERRAVVS